MIFLYLYLVICVWLGIIVAGVDLIWDQQLPPSKPFDTVGKIIFLPYGIALLLVRYLIFILSFKLSRRKK